MKKQYAINLIGGTGSKAARTIGRTPQAVTQWKDPLTRPVEALVLMAFNALPPSQRRKNLAMANAALAAEIYSLEAS